MLPVNRPKRRLGRGKRTQYKMEKGETRGTVLKRGKAQRCAASAAENQPGLRLRQVLWVQLTKQPRDPTPPSSETHTTSAGVKKPQSSYCKVSATHNVFLQTETRTLAESSAHKLMLQQCPLNREAVTAFFPPPQHWCGEGDACPKDRELPHATDTGRSLGCAFWGIYPLRVPTWRGTD